MNRRLEILALLALGPAAACYSYQTIPLDDVRPAAEVRLRLTPEAAPRVSAVVGYPTEDVQGTVVQVQDGAVLLTVPAPMPPEGATGQQLYQRLDVPTSQVVEVQRRRLNPLKTYGLVAAAVVGAGLLAAEAFAGVGSGSGSGTKGGANNRLALPLSRLWLGP